MAYLARPDTGRSKRYFFMVKFSPWLILAVPIGLTFWLKYYLIFKALYISLFRYDPINTPGTFIGLENFRRIFSASYYWDAWSNTFVFLFLDLSMTFIIPIIQALLLNEVIRFKQAFTTLYVIPALVPGIVNVIIWKWIWHPNYGMANEIVKFFGGQPQAWLSDPALTKFSIIFPGVVGGGLTVLLYLSAIQGISTDIKESAVLEGCVGWGRIRHIILPNIKFIIFIHFIMGVIISMQILDLPYMYTAGGPSGASTSMGLYIYQTFHQDFDYGRGSAASIIMLIVVATMSFIQMKFDRSERN